MNAGGESVWLEKAAELHRKYPVILIHDHDPVVEDLAECRTAGVSGKMLVPVLDVYVDENPHASAPIFEGWTEHACQVLRETRESFAATGWQVMLATSAKDFRQAHREGKVAVLLGAEGGKLVEGKVERLQGLHDAGLRSLQLRWNCSNQIIAEEREGLTGFGRELVPALNEAGILIDGMHAGRQAFFELAEISSKPFVLSHGGAHGALAKSRYPGWCAGDYRTFVDDEMLRVLAETGGVLGINLYGLQFAPMDAKGMPDFSVEDVAEHFQYVAGLVGVDVLAYGPDYFPTHGNWANFGPKGSVFREQFVVPKSGLTRLTARLLELGWNEADVAKVLGGNFLRVCERVFGM